MASIERRGTGFRITVSKGYDIHGKKLTEKCTFTPDPSLSPKKQEKAAQAFAAEFEAKVLNGLVLDGRKTTLAEFSERWLAEYAEQNFQPATIQKYKEELRDKILPALGHMKLTDIRPHNVNAFLVGLTEDGCRRDGRCGGYSKGSITKTRNVLSSILRVAAEWEIISSNPCDKVRTKGEDTADNIKFFTPEQTAAFLAFIEEPYKARVSAHDRVDDTGKGYRCSDYTRELAVPEQLRVLFNLAVYAGLRKGELVPLKWADVDFERDTIRVQRAITIVDGKPVVKPPKSKSSNRVVSIPHSLSIRLKRLKLAQTETRLKLGDYWHDWEDWIFTQKDGRMMNYSTPYESLQDVLRRYNETHDEQLPMIPLHGLRHTSATLLIASQTDIKTISSRLGHAQTSTTMNVYVHQLKEADQKAADALEGLLKKQAK